ncbi:GntR family transcriptional regulator [Pseudooceanicola sp. MF1-13]|uniref:GntR family transcriptional regulator n=1 Tax=Pseudooceanicola sp. MF1-13 TaxID=3379095 RepID=UPI0038913B99
MQTRQDPVDWLIEDKPTLRDQTVHILREAILTEVFAPGTKLVERSLADQTGVSRTSIREALSQLEAEKLVTRVPGKGMHVAKLTIAEAREIYEVRAVLESAMARLFVERATQDDLDDLIEAVKRARNSDTPDMARAHAQALDEVFDIITRGGENSIARQMAGLLRTRVTYLRTITSKVAPADRRQESLRRLDDIRRAFEERDADRAESLIRAYVERSAEFAITVLGSMTAEADVEKD